MPTIYAGGTWVGRLFDAAFDKKKKPSGEKQATLRLWRPDSGNAPILNLGRLGMFIDYAANSY